VPASGGRVSGDDGWHDLSGRPADLAGDERRDPRLGVDPADQLLAVHDHRLQLDHQDGPGWMHCEQVDPTALSVPVEADFCASRPAEALEATRYQRCQGRVIGVQEPIDELALPADIPRDRQLDGVTDGADGSDRHLPRAPAFEVGARSGANARRLGQVNEPPSALLSSGTDRHAESPIVHAPIVPRQALLPDFFRSEDEPIDGGGGDGRRGPGDRHALGTLPECEQVRVVR
jgi:hypothetical protein